MIMGFISQIDALFVKPTELTFSVEGETKTLGIAEIMEMREKDWFSRGVAASEECNRSIVNASVQQLHQVRTLGSPRQLIAVAFSIRHATQVAALYKEHGLRVEVLHSDLKDDERDRIEATLRSGVTDVVVQVNISRRGLRSANTVRRRRISSLPQPITLCTICRPNPTALLSLGYAVLPSKSCLSYFSSRSQR